MTRSMPARLPGLLAAAVLCTNVAAQVRLGVDDPLPFAWQIPSGSTIEYRTGTDGEIAFTLGFGISDGDERFLRLDLAGASFASAPGPELFGCQNAGAACQFALGNNGPDFVIVGLSAVGTNLAPDEPIRFALNAIDAPGDLFVPDTSGQVGLRYRLYEDPVEASRPGGGDRVLFQNAAPIISFVDGLEVGILEDPPRPGLCVADVTQDSLAFAPSPDGSRFEFQNNGALGDMRCFCNRLAQRGRPFVFWSDGLRAGEPSRLCNPDVGPCLGPFDRFTIATELLLGVATSRFTVAGTLPLDFAVAVDAKGQSEQPGPIIIPILPPTGDPAGPGVYIDSQDFELQIRPAADSAGEKGVSLLPSTRFPDCSTVDFPGVLTDGNEAAVIDVSNRGLTRAVSPFFGTALCLGGNGVDPFRADEFTVSWAVDDTDPAVEFDEPEREFGTACAIDRNGSEDNLLFNLTKDGFYAQFIRITNPTGTAGEVFVSCFDDANEQSVENVPLDRFTDRDGDPLPAELAAGASTDLIAISDVWDSCGITPMGGEGSPFGPFLRLRVDGAFGETGPSTGQGRALGIRLEGLAVSRDGSSFENISR